jgi:hypothetical protein
MISARPLVGTLVPEPGASDVGDQPERDPIHVREGSGIPWGAATVGGTGRASVPPVPENVAAVLRLWTAYVRAKAALIEAGAVRSLKSAEADLAEWLVAQLVEGELPASKPHAAFDVVAADKKIQVKSLCKASDNPNGYIVQPKDRHNDPASGATHYAFVCTSEDLETRRAATAIGGVSRRRRRSQTVAPDGRAF